MVLMDGQNINGMKLQHRSVNNIDPYIDEVNTEFLDNEINNNNLIELINKFTQELNEESKQRQTNINSYNKNLQKRFVRPRWLKLHQKHGGLSDQLHGLQENDFYEDVRSEPNEFSKVYLILNPESTLSDSDIRDLTNAVSSMLSSFKTSKNAKYNDETMRSYKGFIMRDKRRRFKESKEIYAKDSIERDYKQKRVRSDYGGGGRTAVPYVRHRGDIYERD